MRLATLVRCLLSTILFLLATRCLAAPQEPVEKKTPGQEVAGSSGDSPGDSAAAEIADEKTHAELILLRDRLIKAVNEVNVDGVLACLHPDIVLTAQHSEVLDVSRGRPAVRKYFEDRMVGPQRVLEAYEVEPTVDELTILHGQDTGVSYGSSVDHYTLLDGTKFDTSTRWSATVVRENGQWLVASLHVSENLFKNAVLDYTERTYKRMAIGSGIGGFVLGLVCMYMVGRRKK